MFGRISFVFMNRPIDWNLMFSNLWTDDFVTLLFWFCFKNIFLFSEVYKKVAKRKSLDTFDEGIKEKKIKYDEISIKEEDNKTSLTDNLPITGIHFSQKKGEENPEISNFTGVNSHTDHELGENERRFRLVKNHLVTTEGDVVQSFSNGSVYIFVNNSLRIFFCE